MKKIVLLMGIVALLNGCGKENQKTYTVNELAANEDLLKQVVNECSEMSVNERNSSVNCARVEKVGRLNQKCTHELISNHYDNEPVSEECQKFIEAQTKKNKQGG